MISFQTEFYFVAALLLLVLPLRWILSAVLAGLVHEMGHIAAVFLVRGRIRSFRISTNGCVLETCPLDRWQQFASILAGPLGGLTLLFFYRAVPEAALCAVFQSLYNLIPIRPLDGGRLSYLLLEWFTPNHAESIMRFLERACIVIICVVAVTTTVITSGIMGTIFMP